MKRRAKAQWSGGLEDGTGTLSTTSGALEAVPYGFEDRFGEGPETNPEELIGAAHAGCFAMALAGELGKAGMTPDSIDVMAEVSLEKDGDGFSITSVHLDLAARIPDADADAFSEAAEGAKQGCPVSRLLDAKITLDARLAN